MPEVAQRGADQRVPGFESSFHYGDGIFQHRLGFGKTALGNESFADITQNGRGVPMLGAKSPFQEIEKLSVDCFRIRKIGQQGQSYAQIAQRL